MPNFFLNIFPFLVSSTVVISTSIALCAYTDDYSFNLGDYMRTIIFSYVGGIIAKSLMEELFHEHAHYILEDFYQREM